MQNTSNKNSADSGCYYGQALFLQNPYLSDQGCKVRIAREAASLKVKYPWLNVEEFILAAVEQYQGLQEKASR
jgi:hypothetical protein